MGYIFSSYASFQWSFQTVHLGFLFHHIFQVMVVFIKAWKIPFISSDCFLFKILFDYLIYLSCIFWRSSFQIVSLFCNNKGAQWQKCRCVYARPFLDLYIWNRIEMCIRNLNNYFPNFHRFRTTNYWISKWSDKEDNHKRNLTCSGVHQLSSYHG